MENVTLADVARALGLRPPSGGSEAVGVSTDSRTIREGDVFFAIRGERYDGHAFVGPALDRGAAAAVVTAGAPVQAPPERLLPVADTVTALQDLAAWYRGRFSITVVGVTGTNGKTTTKDMSAAVLSTRMRTMKTEGNLNNHIGVPLTLLGISSRHDAAVIEMGMSHPGEIGRLASIARPSVGVITNVAEAHLESMRDLDTVATAKGELIEALPADGTAVLNADDPRVMGQAVRTRARVVTFGIDRSGDVRAVDVRERGVGVDFTVEGDGRATLPVPGAHNVANALAAIAVGEVLGVDRAAAIEGLASFSSSPMRMSVAQLGRRTLLNDAYNANPGSVGAALRTLVAVAGGRPAAAVLGDMLELGERSRAAHREIGRLAAGLGVDFLLLYGHEVQEIRSGALEGGTEPARVLVFGDRAALVRALRGLPDDAVILVKGSRGMRMEEVVELLVTEAPAS
jgi:UDP-N-acetylmuramoyl-tripeptide--D-alanyl-D-alanine ligase